MIGSVKHLVVGTAGHIDHGKSTLVEALTGIDPDRLQEEKARGITIDLGFAPYRHGDTQLAFVDVPGHERFVRNMLAGASGIDCVLLVIAADESVMPQTREHFDICRLLEVGGGLVALTKTDLVDEETLELVRLETRELIAGSFLEGAPLVPVSARTEAGLDDLRRELDALADGVGGRADSGIPRLAIDRAFSVKGFGTVVTGTQASGVIEGEGELTLMPAGRRVKVRGLQVHGEPRSRSRAGQRVAVNLAAVGVGDLQRGDTLTTEGGLCASRRFDGRVTLLDGAPPLKYGARVRFHQGTSEIMARLAIGSRRSAAGGGGGDAEQAPEFPAVLEPGGSVFARLHLERPVALTRGDRFVLRAYSPMITIGGGVVLDPDPPGGRLRSAAGFRRSRRLDALDDDAAAVLTMVGEAGGVGATLGALAPRAGRTVAEIRRVAAALVEAGALVAMGERLVAAATAEAAAEALLGIAGAYHRDHPLEPGLPREEARERLTRLAGPALFEHVAQALVAAGRLAAGRHLVLATHRIVLSDEETRVKDELAGLLLREGLSPPDPAAWARERGVDEALADRMLKLLVRDGTVERLEALVFHRQVLERLREDVAGLRAGSAEPVRIDVAWFKQRFGITRKFAIPLLEYLDRVRVTRRAGRERIVV